MHGILDGLLVGGVILASVMYATYSLGPKALRRRLAGAAAMLLRKLPVMLRLRGAALRLEVASQKAGGSCGGCDNCGSAAPTGSAAPAAAEIRIPVSTIRRR